MRMETMQASTGIVSRTVIPYHLQPHPGVVKCSMRMLPAASTAE
jgi:hypothetical protein